MFTNSLPRLFLCALTGAALFFAVSSGLAPRPGHPDTVTALRGVMEEFPRGEVLEACGEDCARRYRRKQGVVNELIAGRLTLREAVARFRELNAAVPFRAVTGEEDLWRNVYFWVKMDLRGEPGSAAVLPRLRAEYRQHFGHDPQPLAEYESPL